MTTLLFPDNTVLVNFAIINRMDLLERLANGNGRWCATVAAECSASARQPDLGGLADAGDIFGPPWFPDPVELLDTTLLREELASPGDHPRSHLGEAETLAIMIRRRVHGFFVTDDNDAARLATKNGVTVVKTWRLLKVASRQGWVDPDTLWGYVQTLRSRDRGSPLASATGPRLISGLRAEASSDSMNGRRECHADRRPSPHGRSPCPQPRHGAGARHRKGTWTLVSQHSLVRPIGDEPITAEGATTHRPP